MATSTVSPDSNDIRRSISDAADRIDQQLGLAQWVELARKLLDDIQNAAAVNPQLDEQLKFHDIRFNHFWEDRQASALFAMFEDVAQGVASMNSAAEELAKLLAKEASHV